MKKPLPILLSAALAAALVAFGNGESAAQTRDRTMLSVSQYPLFNDDGQRLPNHSVRLAAPIDTLPGVVVAANPTGTTTLVEFYDLNCPYCRIASADIADMVAVDPQLRLVLAAFPVLGVASIAASRVELAVAKLGTPQQFYDFHQKIYSRRGVTDGLRALEVAHGLGFDEQALTKLGDSDQITAIMKAHVALGNSLGLAATPSFVIDGVAVLGYPGRDGLQKIVDAARSCGKIAC
ncbi:MAG TPA: DsbA family protein [Xanthobacteraceae bacterium]|jgi:protein-disulfide isomerase|nr:DsbA family protein [Xanthobacteraceae bacterium]